jgi:Arc/MetJ family transcription regulator
MRITIDIDDALMAQARKVCGHATEQETVDQALRLMVRLRQHETQALF